LHGDLASPLSITFPKLVRAVVLSKLAERGYPREQSQPAQLWFRQGLASVGE
jgi:hypothetical protein